MTNMISDKFCEQCGARLPADAQFCEQCGARIILKPAAPQVFHQAPPPLPGPPLEEKKQNLTWLVIGIGCLSLFCIGALVVGGFFFLREQGYFSQESVTPVLSTPLPTQMLAAEPTASPVKQSIAEPTEIPEEIAIEPTPLPTAPPEELSTPSTAAIVSAQQVFSRWSLDYSRQWELSQTDVYITDINQDHSWVISLTKPESLVMVIPPHPSAYYSGGVNITVNVKPGDFVAAGPYGVLCHFQDANNYYLVEIQGDSYGIGKMVDGLFAPLTEPYWQKSQFIGDRGANDFIELGVTCVDYSIGVSINGLGETYPMDDPARSFSGGAVALFGASSQEAVDMLMGIFYFKDLVIEPIN